MSIDTIHTDARGKLEIALTKAILHGTQEVVPSQQERDDVTYWLNPTDASKSFMENWFFNNQFDPDNDGQFGSFLFLQFKSASVTDIARSELRSLVELNIKQHYGDPHRVVYYTTKEFTQLFENLIASLNPTTTLADNEDDFLSLVELIADSYSELFYRALLLDHYFTSASVHVPPSLRLSIENVVGESGYIHSAGRLIYIRQMSKSYDRDVTIRINNYLNATDSERNCDKRVSVTPYAKEFFDPFEKSISSTSTRNGLDNVKFNLAKQHVGSTKLIDYLQGLEQDPYLHGRVVIPSGLLNYKTERQEQNADPDRTIWLISDYSTNIDSTSKKYRRTDTRYLIVYGQTIYNKSQLITTKERKPAWYAPVTVPSTLSAALVNSTRVSGSPEKIRVLDPFCGTGTFLLDAGIRYKGACLIGLDKNPVVPQVIEDNLRFFAEDKVVLESYHNFCQTIGHSDERDSSVTETLLSTLNALAVEYDFKSIVGAINHIIENDFSETSFINYFRELSAGGRAEHYVVWRALVLNRFSISRKPESVMKIIETEKTTVNKELESIKYNVSSEPVQNALTFFQGTYSKASKINPHMFRKLLGGLDCHHLLGEDFDLQVSKVSNVLSAIESGVTIFNVDDSISVLDGVSRKGTSSAFSKFDLIITDPPYGVNTSEGGADVLFPLFKRLTRALCSLLSPHGELILTLPDFTRNGQHIPFYQTRGMIVPEIRTVLAELGFDHGTYSIKEKYWSSPSVLDRTIVHVKLL